jgi:hypothetical protein
MFPGVSSATRTLPVDAVLLDEALLHVRRDTEGTALRWTLGRRGAAEVDTDFVRHGPGWTTSVRLWNPNGLAVAAATLRCMPAGADQVCVTLEPTPAAPAVWGDDGADLADLARVALDEFAEELLWHVSRAGLTQRG